MYQMEPHLNKFSPRIHCSSLMIPLFSVASSPSLFPLLFRKNKTICSHYEPIYALMYLTMAGTRAEK